MQQFLKEKKFLKVFKTISFKRIINWNKYQSKLTEQAQSRYLDYLIDPTFQGFFYRLKIKLTDQCTQEIIFQKEK